MTTDYQFSWSDLKKYFFHVIPTEMKGTKRKRNHFLKI